MKIAMTSTGESPSLPIDQRFGRARQFLVHDLGSREWSVIDNSQDFNAAHGAGIQAAQHIVESGAKALITGSCGPKAFAVLSAAGISVYQGFDGTAEEAVQAYEKGELVESHEENAAAPHQNQGER